MPPADRILLEAVPDAVGRVDGVVDLEDDEVFAVGVVHRLRTLVGAATRRHAKRINWQERTGAGSLRYH